MTPRFYAVISNLPKFGGFLSERQKGYMELVFGLMQEYRFNRQKCASCFATNYWETGGQMLPVREGFAKSDAEAIRIVTRLYNEKKIKVNYALPDKETGLSYFGRGPIQLTWKSNYEKLSKYVGEDLVHSPEKALDPVIGAKILVIGMHLGLFTGVSLDDVSEPITSAPNFENDRAVVNGKDRAKEIAKVADVFYEALADVDVLAKSRIITGAKESVAASYRGIGAAVGAGALGVAEAVVGDSKSIGEAVTTGKLLAEAIPFLGGICVIIAVASFIVIKNKQKKIEDARREDNILKGS